MHEEPKEKHFLATDQQEVTVVWLPQELQAVGGESVGWWSSASQLSTASHGPNLAKTLLQYFQPTACKKNSK